MVKAVLLFLLLFQPEFSFGENESASNWSINQRIQRTIHSKVIGHDIRLFIRMPRGYEGEKESYPVLYYMDGYAYEDIVSGIVRVLEFSGKIPKILLVGIDSDVDNYEEWRMKRAMNLTPTSANTYESYGISASGTGGGDKYLNALVEEVIPFVDANYRTKENERALVGHSFGGLFVLQTLFSSHSNLFNKYLSSSPSIPWDDRVMLKQEKAFAKKREDLPARLYMSVGGLENEIEDK